MGARVAPAPRKDYRRGGGGLSAQVGTTCAEYVDGTLAREYLTDESGGIVKMLIPAGQANPGTYLVVWNGHGDATGLWRITADGTLELANSFSYGTWGEPGITAGTNSATGLSYGDLGFRFLYVGRYGVQWDGAYGPPLYLMGARHYHATFGRFLQPDPSALEANLYAYAENSPVTKVDPDGTLWFIAFVIAAGTRVVAVARAAGRIVASIARTGVRYGGRLRGANRVDPNKLHHIFDQAKHNLAPMVARYGSREAVYRLVERAAQAWAKAARLPEGAIRTFEVQVGGFTVVVQGRWLGGVFRISDFWIKGS